MPAIFSDTKVTGTIVPISNGTRLRTASSTFTTVLNSYSKGAVVEVDLVREYKSTDMTEYHMAGDLWARVVKVDGAAPKKSNGELVTGEAWMAIRYLGSPVCNSHYIPAVETPPNGETPAIVGMIAVLKYENGTQSEPINMVVTDEPIA
jgi:hypothetical protein